MNLFTFFAEMQLILSKAYLIKRYYVCFKKEKGVDLNIKKIDSDNIV